MSDIKDFDSFWIDRGQTLVTETFANLNQHLSNYAKYLKYLKGFFIVSGLTAEAFYKTTDASVFLSFIVPLIVLYVAIFQISVSRKVELKKLDLRSPLMINEAYDKLITGLKEEVQSAKWWVTYATVAVLIGGSLAIYNLNKENHARAIQEKIEKREDKILGYQDDNLKEFTKGKKLKTAFVKEKNKITLEAKFPEDEVVLIEMITKADDTITKEISIPKLCDFKTELLNAKQLLSTKIK